MNLATLEQAAEWRGRVDLNDLSEVCLLLCAYYNNAILAPEVTGLGAGLLAILERARYWNLYRRVSVDTIGGPTVMLGWDTNRKTKPAMVSLMQKALREDYIKIRSKTVLAEMGSYTKTILHSKSGIDDNTAKMSAPPGKNDDACVAAMIGNAVSHYTPGSLTKAGNVEESRSTTLDHRKWSSEDWDAYEKAAEKTARRLSGRRRQ